MRILLGELHHFLLDQFGTSRGSAFAVRRMAAREKKLAAQESRARASRNRTRSQVDLHAAPSGFLRTIKTLFSPKKEDLNLCEDLLVNSETGDVLKYDVQNHGLVAVARLNR